MRYPVVEFIMSPPIFSTRSRASNSAGKLEEIGYVIAEQNPFHVKGDPCDERCIEDSSQCGEYDCGFCQKKTRVRASACLEGEYKTGMPTAFFMKPTEVTGIYEILPLKHKAGSGQQEIQKIKSYAEFQEVLGRFPDGAKDFVNQIFGSSPQ